MVERARSIPTDIEELGRLLQDASVTKGTDRVLRRSALAATTWRR